MWTVRSDITFCDDDVVGTQTLSMRAAETAMRSPCRRMSVRLAGQRGMFSETSPMIHTSPPGVKAATDHLVRGAHALLSRFRTVRTTTAVSVSEKLIPLCITHLLENENSSGDGMMFVIGLRLRTMPRRRSHVAARTNGRDVLFRRTFRTDKRKSRSPARWDADAREWIVTDERGTTDTRSIFKAEKEFGWSPGPFLHGLRKTIDWYKANVDWWKNIQNGTYREYDELQSISK